MRALNRFLARTNELWSELSISEISGSVGDLGTFIPLAVALARQDAIRLGPALFLAGLSNVATGYIWDVPMCVQPMKSIAAVAIAEGLSQNQVTAAGVWMGIFLVLLSITNGIEWVNLLVPAPVVSGIQMGVGVNLAIHAITMMKDLSWSDGPDCKVFAIACALFCMFGLREKQSNATSQSEPQQNPVGLYLFGLGLLLAAMKLYENEDISKLHLFGAPIASLALKNISRYDWKQGLLEGAIPQLPLTTMNSVISVCCLAHSLYPEKRRQGVGSRANDAVISRKEVSLAMGIMNLVACSFGGMPCCHGSGGLAGQHKFGARHGASVVFLGVNKMVLATVLGGSLLVLLDALPISILGLMLVISGHELAMRGLQGLVQHATTEGGRDMNDFQQALRRSATIALITAIVNIGLHKTHYAALSGWVTYIFYGGGISDMRNRRNEAIAAEVEFARLSESAYRDDPEGSKETSEEVSEEFV